MISIREYHRDRIVRLPVQDNVDPAKWATLALNTLSDYYERRESELWPKRRAPGAILEEEVWLLNSKGRRVLRYTQRDMIKDIGCRLVGRRRG